MDQASRREIGNRIKRARQAKELTQSDLAKNLGMHRSNFSRIEKGDVMPTAKTLIKIKSCVVTIVSLPLPCAIISIL